MGIAISETHQELESVARSLLHKVGARGQARELLDAADEARPAFWSEIADLGWLGLHLSEEFGGSGFGLPELAGTAPLRRVRR